MTDAERIARLEAEVSELKQMVLGLSRASLMHGEQLVKLVRIPRDVAIQGGNLARIREVVEILFEDDGPDDDEHGLFDGYDGWLSGPGDN